MKNSLRTVKENVLINFNNDKEVLKYWEENDGLIFESNILIIPTSKLKEYVDIDNLTKGLNDKVHNISISNSDISITFFNDVSDKILNLKQIYNQIEDITNYVSTVLNKFNIEDYKLICNLKPNVGLMDEYSKIEHEKLRLESKLLKMQSEAMEELYQ